jgi:branched-chain amino acid aminotransferase
VTAPPPPRLAHAWANGRLAPLRVPLIEASDRGFQVGDGVFETIRVCEGRILELSLHAARLAASAAVLEIPLGDDIESTLREAIAELLAADDLVAPGLEVSVRVTVSRGPVEGRNLLPPADVRPTVVVQAWPVTPPSPELLARGLHLAISRIRRDPASPLATVKTTSRADFVHARLEARRASADDALFLTTDGHLAEATSASLFLVRARPAPARGGSGARDASTRDGQQVGSPAPAVAGAPSAELLTPALECGVLVGTTREWLLGWAPRAGLAVREAWLLPEDLFAASEAFLASSVAGVLPVTRVDGRPIGDGRPGPWTRRAREAREAFACGRR